MSKRVGLALAAVAGLAMGMNAGDLQAATVTHGFLSSDDTSGIIVDSANKREYTRLDAFNLTFAQTQAAIGSGGAYEGWSIMTSDIMDQFTAALLGVANTACDGAVGYGQFCGTVAGWVDGQLGASYSGFFDYVAFLNTNGGNPIGLLQINSAGVVNEYENWSIANTLDSYPTINLMLYRDISEVPVPAALPLLAAGLGAMGLVGRRKRDKARA